MFGRNINNILIESVASFPAVVLTGPRQSGKTTLLRTLFPDYPYFNLEAPDTLALISGDPRGFIEANPQCIFDEAQEYPDLFSYLQVYMDERGRAGQYILSGSKNFLLLENITQTLAGRTALFELLPLSYSELTSLDQYKQIALWDMLYKGLYPRPYYEKVNYELWYQAYLRTYLERDVRTVLNVRNLNQFQLFMKLCAGCHGQQLNLSSIAQDCGISQTTATHWLSVLEASYILFRLPPYYNNYRKRLVKRPKLYFYDPGIVCHLLGIDSSEHLQAHSSRGAIFEGYIISEIIKYFTNQGKTPPIYYWRDQTGHEVDLIIEQGSKLSIIEIKSSATYSNSLVSGLQKWLTLTKAEVEQQCLIYTGLEQTTVKGINIIPWQQLLSIFNHNN